ncbi:MAG TPA: XdhC/CoxI family protein, partial [Gemmatimonadales bacterium]|nr:XdhC/CoxI family protein [Gemmatimonadales bacterium]
MRDLLADYDRLIATGERLGRAVVTDVWGSAPRPEGSSMLATASGAVAGSVSGGCVESAVAAEIGAAIERGTPKVIAFGVTDERAWSVGLACGGTITVLVEPLVRPEVLAAARGPGGEVVATAIEGPVGTWARIGPGGAVDGDLGRLLDASALADAARNALAGERSRSVRLGAPGGQLSVFLEVFPCRPRLVIVGAVHIAAALVPLARALGYRAIVADGRERFVTRERFPDADELHAAWPDAAFEQIGLDADCYVCILSHDPKFDEPALRLALRSSARYIGAIGSAKTQGKRRERLRAEGFTDDQIARVRGPIGLDLGGRSPEETALAILA